MKLINKIGKRFGRLTVLYRTDNNIHNHAQLVCECDCGNECIVSSSNLGGSSTSCGCKRIERAIETNSLRPYEALYRLLKRTKSGHAIYLTYEEFLTFTEEKFCHYCDDIVKWSEYDLVENGSAYNLDRKDTNGPYSKDNCVVCCKRCNIGKSRFFTYSEWKNIGNLIKTWKK